MLERLMKAGVNVAHAWGMTETSPIGTTGAKSWDWDDLTFEQQVDDQADAGQGVPFGVELRTVDLGDSRSSPAARWQDRRGAAGARAVGHQALLQGRRRCAVSPEQWFDTGDVGMIHPDGTLQLTDRTKDVIKSGGEWISSVELENAPSATRRGRGCRHRHPSPQVGRAADPGGRQEAGHGRHRRGNPRSPGRARSPSGGCPTRSSSSTKSRTPATTGKISKKDKGLREASSGFQSWYDGAAMASRSLEISTYSCAFSPRDRPF
jgi:hypothetical protein